MFTVSCDSIDTALELALRVQAEPDRLPELIGHLQMLRASLEGRLLLSRFESLCDLEKADFLYRESENVSGMARLLQISERRIYQLLRLVRLPQEQREVIREGRLSERQVRPFLKLPAHRLLESLEVVRRHEIRPSQTELLASLVRQNPLDSVELLASQCLLSREKRGPVL